MTDLQIRRIPFRFEGVDFIWNPHNPAFSVMMNTISFLVIGLEKYFCQAMRDAEKHITDPAIMAEAKAFNLQEAIHSRAHHKHCKALIDRYPGLQRALDAAIEDFDRIYAEKDLKYHLAYAGGLEATFTPTFGMILNNRATLFGGGDPRVASLFLWHFCEEIEHRSSAISVYNHVYGDNIYRLRQVRSMYKHSAACGMRIRDIFVETIPGLQAMDFKKGAFKSVPRADRMRTAIGIVASQLPWYDHEGQKLPAYYREWVDRYERGEDMTLAFDQAA
jgi:predicted metal-dependent hydrolase